jgi:hypothetical protein
MKGSNVHKATDENKTPNIIDLPAMQGEELENFIA